jgi:hypothetical protein
MLSAHLTMFHHLFDDHASRLLETTPAEISLPLSFAQVWFLGRGVATEVVLPGLVELREAFKRQARGAITPQDN